MKLTQKFSTFPDTLGYAAFAPLPKAFFDDHAGWLAKPVGNGPYTIDSYAKGSQMQLKRWDDYPGEDKAQNGGITLKVYTDNNTAYTDLTAGNLDLVDDVPASQLKNVSADLGDRYINTPAGIIQTLSIPFYDPDWNKPGQEKLRQGLSMAIDRNQITETIFQKTRTPAVDWTSPVLGEEGGFKDVCGDFCKYDAAQAKKLVAEASYGFTGPERFGDAAVALQTALSREGVTYRDVLNRTREHLACGYLEGGGYSIKEVAFLLGFADATSFSRAFKRWTRSSPQQFAATKRKTGTPASSDALRRRA